MLKVLVVEDNPDKLRHVLTVLKQVQGSADEMFDIAHDALEAKRLLKDHAYDLLILDLSLPARPDLSPVPEGGLKLLEEILGRDIYKTPREIVGLTAYDDVRDSATSRFAEDLWSVLQYDPGSEAWAEQLKRKLRHILVARRTGSPNDRRSDLCVVVALPDPELKAVLALPWSWEVHEELNDGTIYHRGYYMNDGSQRVVYAAATMRMGMTAAAVLATKMMSVFRPRYVAMTGITAGIKGCCELGDVIAADPTWDYGSGKHHTLDGSAVFSPAPHQIGLSSFIRGKLGLMSGDSVAFAQIRESWQGPKPPTSLSVRIGPVASGAAVLQDPKIAADIKQQHRKVIGIEMETYGVFAAVEESLLPQPETISLKSVCDFADDEKDDRFQAYAAYTSANALRIFVEKYL